MAKSKRKTSKKKVSALATLFLSVVCAAVVYFQGGPIALPTFLSGFPFYHETTQGYQPEAELYEGEPYQVLNDNVPTFTVEELRQEDSFETYATLDYLGRCGVAYANIGPDLMPTEDRGSIGHVEPSGWQSVEYDIVDGNYLYNRCHLIGFQLTGENANEENLITGTRYLNVEGMLPLENLVADYITTTGNHVLYRVTPVYEGSELVARGLVMEAYSLEDDGQGISFHVYVHNVQPGIEIDYATGESWLAA